MSTEEIKFERITKVRLPFDRRSGIPHENFGIHGLDIWFILKGPKGATQFAVNFGIHLPHVQIEFTGKSSWGAGDIMGFDVGYHASTPQFEGHKSLDSACDLVPGGKCYYDGSGMQAEEWATAIFAIRGAHPEEEVWRRLEQEYRERFER